jgi:hypothetical protein
MRISTAVSTLGNPALNPTASPSHPADFQGFATEDAMKINEDVKAAHEALPDGWYGDVVVTYQAGQPVTIKTTSVKKINTNPQARSPRPNEFNR